MAKKQKKSVNSASVSPGSEKLCAILSYLFLGILWYIADDDIKKSKFVKFHVRQALVLLVVDAVFWLVSLFPIIGWITAPILYLIILVFLILGIINAATGKEKDLPIIGKYADKFDI